MKRTRCLARAFKSAVRFKPVVLLLFTTAPCCTAFGVVYVAPEAPSLLPGLNVPAGVTQINGAIGDAGDVDLYRLQFAPGTVINVNIVITDPINAWFDTDVVLFNATGNPFATRDPNTFTFIAPTSTVYLGLADWDIAATDEAGNFIADDYSGILRPDSVLGGWEVTSSPWRSGPYEIHFSMPTVPEPVNIVSALTGGLMLLLGSKRRKITPLN